MIKLSLTFLVLLVTTTYAQIGPDGTGTVNGYYIGPGADLSGADISSADLSGANLTGANLTNTFLRSANLSFASLSEANLTGVISGNITGTPTLPSGYQMANGYIVGPSADLSGADLTNADLTGADLSDADLTVVISGNITGTPTLPSGYQMISGYIVGPGVDLSGADLNGADLSYADLSDAFLFNARLDDADLSGADLSYADLSDAFLFNANLSGADLSGANLTNADLTLANIRYTIWNSVISQSDYDAVVAERDARPTQAAYDAVVAERDAKLTLDEVKDLRAGSTMIEIENGIATLSMEVEESSDLEIWTSGSTTTLTIPADTDTKFFRFKMAE